MNPLLPQSVVDDAMRDDPEAARAEYLAEFRSDVATFLDAGLVEDCARPEPLEVAPARGVSYFAFVDPAGGGADEFTLAIGHVEGDRVVVDLVRGRKGSPAQIVAEYSKLIRSYGIGRVWGDRYAGRWPRDEFEKFAIAYGVADQDRSGLYQEFLAALNSARVELPPDDRFKRQLVGLERRTGRSGKDTIDHAPGAHDDRANAVAGLVANATRRRRLAKVTIQAIHGLY